MGSDILIHASTPPLLSASCVCPSNTAEPLILAVHVAPAGETDGSQAKVLIDSQPEVLRPERVLGDTAYGNGVVRSELAERGIDVLAPVPEGVLVEGQYGKRDFRIDPDAGTVTCPAGHIAVISTSKTGARRAGFPAPTCRACPLKGRCCPTSARRQIAISEHEPLMITARHALADPGTAEHLRRTRPRIERLLGLLVHRYGARKSRYIGSAKARLQAACAAALVNLNPISRHLATQMA